MPKSSAKDKAILKGVRFPPDILAKIESRIEEENAGGNFSSWVLEACKHRLEPQSQICLTQPPAAPPVRGELTRQKKKFADFLMKGLNQTQAAILAGYSEKTARSKGSQLAKEPCVLAYMASMK